jgi:hypothetical protein
MRALVSFKAVCYFLVIMLCGLVPQGSIAGELQNTKGKDARRVTLQVTNVPLNEVLSILAKNVPLEIRGTVPSQELITVQFSNATLEEALSRIMRGYNYVLVRPEESTKPLLVVMNKIERSMQNEPASVGPPVPAGALPSPVPLPGAAQTQVGWPRPGMPQVPSGQGPEAFPARVGPAEAGQAGPQGPENQPGLSGPVPSAGPVPATGPIPPFPGTAFGPGAIPPGMAAGQAGQPSAAGHLPPGIPPPGATNPSPGGAGGPLLAPPAQPQQAAQPTPEPVRIMTPFGERSAE